MASTSAFTIQLTPAEESLATLLVDCAHWIDENPQEVDALRLLDNKGEPIGKLRGEGKIELRIAGGWVRDKLLGQQSDDIDVSTSPDPVTGLKFAMLFEKFLALSGKSHLMGKLTKIEAKPEQSKHLETATALVSGLSIDWVQLRGSEVYTNENRIPTVSFGTPLEDAERRDLTINALFYNLHTRQIEDLTGNGLVDLGLLPGGRRIRTPRPPFQTFHDDPLRVVRAVRFAARFGREFELDPDLIAAVKQPEIRDALMDGKKISRERVGIELEKMLLGADPLLAMEIIDLLELHPLIFLYDQEGAVPADGDINTPLPPPNPSIALQAAKIVSQLLSSPDLHPILAVPASDRRTRKRLYLSAGLLPLYGARHAERVPAPPAKKKKKAGESPPPDTWRFTWLGEKVVLEGIKWSAQEKTWASSAHDASKMLIEAAAKFGDAARVPQESDRAEIGLLLRNPLVDDGREHAPKPKDPVAPAKEQADQASDSMDKLKELHADKIKEQTTWRWSLLWSVAVDLVQNGATSVESRPDLIARYNKFVERILEMKLDTLAFAPRLLDGAAVTKLLPIARGPVIADILNVVVRFQLGYPGASADDCKEYLQTPEVLAELEDLAVQYQKKRVPPP